MASPYEVSGTLPQQSIRISLNAQGGASGSPVFNDEGKVIAILFASNQVTSAFALPIKVVTDALELIQKGETPPRYSLGIVVDYKSTDEWVRHCNFPADQADNYVKKFSSAFNRMLVVNSAINQSPAQKSLQVGDVIMEANNQEIGPDLYLLDTIIDQAGHEEKDVEVRRILDFVGAYFFEADEEIIHRMGPKKHRVFICNLKPGSVLLENLPIHGGVNTAVAIVDIDGHSIETLDDIVKLIPELTKKKNFHMKFQNFFLDIGFGGLPNFNQTEHLLTLSYSPHYGVPQLFERGDRYQWELSIINVNKKEENKEGNGPEDKK